MQTPDYTSKEGTFDSPGLPPAGAGGRGGGRLNFCVHSRPTSLSGTDIAEKVCDAGGMHLIDRSSFIQTG